MPPVTTRILAVGSQRVKKVLSQRVAILNENAEVQIS